MHANTDAHTNTYTGTDTDMIPKITISNKSIKLHLQALRS
jgi:hypothetical protein